MSPTAWWPNIPTAQATPAQWPNQPYMGHFLPYPNVLQQLQTSLQQPFGVHMESVPDRIVTHHFLMSINPNTACALPTSKIIPLNSKATKPTASAKNISADRLAQQIQSCNVMMLRFTSRKKDSGNNNKYTSPLKLNEELLDKMKSFPIIPVPILRHFAKSNLSS